MGDLHQPNERMLGELVEGMREVSEVLNFLMDTVQRQEVDLHHLRLALVQIGKRFPQDENEVLFCNVTNREGG